MSESLKSNTALTKLNLRSEDKRKKTHEWHPSTIHSFHFSSHQQTTTLETQMTFINKSLFSFIFTTTDNYIGDTGATSLSESLKSNTTLTELNLSGEDKRKNTHK